MTETCRFTSVYFDSPLIVGRVMDILEPPSGVTRKDAALFIVHGGGWRGGSRSTFHQIMEQYALRGYTVCSTDYRLYAGNVLEQLRDIRDGYMMFADHLQQSGREPRIFVYGESAGAHLASLLLCSDLEKPRQWLKPAGGILHATPDSLNPWEAMMPSFRKSIESIVGAAYENAPELYERLALKNHISPDNPTLFFIEAELEHLFAPRCTWEIVRKHRQMGIASLWKMYAKVEHGFFYELTRSAQREAFADIAAFMDGTFAPPFPETYDRSF